MQRFAASAVVLLLSACVTQQVPRGLAGGPESAAIRAVVDDVYAIVSGDRGADRPWDRLEGHFLAGARLTASRALADGAFEVRGFTPQEFVANARRSSAQRAFHESPLVTRVLQFQGVAVVVSSYEARVGEGPEMAFRGVNTFQLVKTPDGWKIASIAWSDEDERVRLPDGWAQGEG